jgi:cyclophilin family peptidyl-prolyl cis-trans isomerase
MGRIRSMRRLRCAVALFAAFAIPGFAAAGTTSTLVQFNFNVTNGVHNDQTVLVDLFDNLTPATVANFLNYVNSGEYQNTVIHRSVPGFIVQGGGDGIPANLTDSSSFPHIATTFPSPTNEFNRTNTRGTIAMAKLPGNPNSATSEWFFNLANNSANLDNQNGGFTAFGWVVGPGMTNVVDKIATDPRFYYKNFNDTSQPAAFPVQDYTSTSGNPVVQANLVILNSVTIVKTHPAFQNPFRATDVDNDSLLSSSDLTAVLSDLIHGGHAVAGAFSGTNYLDVNGDGFVGASDALQIIDALAIASLATPTAMPLAQPHGLAMSMGAAPMAVVPEPSSLALATAGVLAFGGYALRRRSRPAAGRWPMRGATLEPYQAVANSTPVNRTDHDPLARIIA